LSPPRLPISPPRERKYVCVAYISAFEKRVKAGSGIGGFIPSKIMQYFGYIPNHTQSVRSLFGINFSFVWLPAILFLLATIPMFFYAKYENNEAKVRADLAAQN